MKELYEIYKGQTAINEFGNKCYICGYNLTNLIAFCVVGTGVKKLSINDIVPEYGVMLKSGLINHCVFSYVTEKDIMK